MTKKKIRYSEFPSGEKPAAPATPPPAETPRAARPRKAEPAIAPVVPATAATPEVRAKAPAPVVATVEAAASIPPAPAKPKAPLDLARALAAARASEAASEGWAKTPATPTPVVPAPAPVPPLPRATVTMSLARLTPARGSDTIAQPGLRLTPARGMDAIPHPGMRLTPSRGMEAIPQSGLRLTPSHGLAIIPSEPAVTAEVPREAARPLRERARARTGTVELLVFRMAHELFGIDLVCVEEAIDLPPVSHVPEMPTAMLGVITVRGSLTSTYTPESALGLSMASRGSALIFKRGRGRVALVVDDVDDVYTLDLAQLRDAPGSDASDGILLGVVRRADGLLGLVDAEALIAACQAVPVLETA